MNGYVCAICKQWVGVGQVHQCPGTSPTPAGEPDEDASTEKGES